MKVFFNVLISFFLVVSLSSCLTLNAEAQEKEVNARIEFKEWLLLNGKSSQPSIKYSIKKLSEGDIKLESRILYYDSSDSLLGQNKLDIVINENIKIDQVVLSPDKTGTIKKVVIQDIFLNDVDYSSVSKTFLLEGNFDGSQDQLVLQ